MDTWAACFHLLAIVNSAAMNRVYNSVFHAHPLKEKNKTKAHAGAVVWTPGCSSGAKGSKSHSFSEQTHPVFMPLWWEQVSLRNLLLLTLNTSTPG